MTTVRDLVKDYVDIRNRLREASAAFKILEKNCKASMLELETDILAIGSELGVDSFKTEFGTAYKVVKTYARLGQGPDCKINRQEYAIRTGDFGLFTNHVNKTHAKELLEDGVNLAEVGIDWITENSISVLKPK